MVQNGSRVTVPQVAVIWYSHVHDDISDVPLRAIRYHSDNHLYVVKYHHTIILPLVVIVNTLARLLNPLQISKVSSFVPSILKRIILFTTVHEYEVKLPTTTIFPSFCIAIDLIISLN